MNISNPQSCVRHNCSVLNSNPFLLCATNPGFCRKCQLVKEKLFGAVFDVIVETVADINVFLSKCGLQSTEGISWFWAPHLYGSLDSDDVFVTDLAGICVLYPSRHTDISRNVSCVSRKTKVSESCFSALEQCAPCVSLCVHPLLLSAERGRSAHQEHHRPRMWNVQQELLAPAAIRHLKLSSPRIKTSPLI